MEEKEAIKKRLLELMELSEDPYYDQYLEQMMKDLETGKATAWQVQKEMDRTFALYQERMGNKSDTVKPEPSEKTVQEEPKPQSENKNKMPENRNTEFKIGAEVFSVIGSILCIAAFVTIGIQFLEGALQGVCLILAAAMLVVISELMIRRLNEEIAFVLSIIGMECLYLAVIINYEVLGNITFLPSAVLLLLVTAAFIGLAWKRASSYLLLAGMISHALMTTAFYIYAKISYENAALSSVFLTISFLELGMIYLKQHSMKVTKTIGEVFTILYAVLLGFMGVLFYNAGMYFDGTGLFQQILTEAMAITAACVFFLLWGEEKKKWMQVYFAAEILLLFHGLSSRELEATVSIAVLFLLIHCLYKIRELSVLDCILEIAVCVQSIFVCRTWYEWILLGTLLASTFFIRRQVLIHEIIVTLGLIIMAAGNLDGQWVVPGILAVCLAGVLFFHYAPWTRAREQKSYNIACISAAGLTSLGSVFLDQWYCQVIVLLLGMIMIFVVFGKHFELYLKRRTLVLTGYLIFMVLTIDTSVYATIILMAVSLALIIWGFRIKDKVYRVAGLVLSGMVCAKLLLFDFRELRSLQRAILFLVTGIIALGISFLYLSLDKKEEKEEAEKLAKNREEVYKEKEDNGDIVRKEQENIEQNKNANL